MFRNERNTTKRKLKRKTEEIIESRNKLSEKSIEVNIMTDKIRQTEKETAQTHFMMIAINSENALLAQGNEETQNMVVEAQRATESIKSQMQLMNHVLDEFKHKKALEDKKMTAIKT